MSFFNSLRFGGGRPTSSAVPTPHTQRQQQSSVTIEELSSSDDDEIDEEVQRVLRPSKQQVELKQQEEHDDAADSSDEEYLNTATRQTDTQSPTLLPPSASTTSQSIPLTGNPDAPTSASSSSSAATSTTDADATSTSSSSAIDSIIAKDGKAALAHKQQGNIYFAHQEFDPAISEYTQAILLCPDDDRTNLAIYYNNRAACYLLQQAYQQCVDDTTKSLEITADNTKALSRRSQAYEKLDNLSDALADCKKIAELEPTNRRAMESVQRLEKLNADKLEKQKEEMMAQLKNLGNSLLGKFGMSLDNFNAVKDPTTGSYSISMNK